MPHVILNGRSLYIEENGPHDTPALLYLHGGPGTGCYDFMHQQSDRLGQHLHLIALDQRGVLRSEPLAEDERLTLDDLLSDLEALRQHLQIESWSVLGHSLGGYLALLYAATYPEAVERLIFENPTFDFHSSVRSLLSAAADQFTANGQEDLAAQCAQAIAAPSFTDELMQSFFHLMTALGDRRNSLYEHRAEAKLFDTDAFAEAVLAFFDETDGEFGWMITHKQTGEILSCQNTAAWFPLASSAKLAIGALVAERVRMQELTWDMVLDDVSFDPREDSHLLYPHLQGRNSQSLHDVVEVMIACRDHRCAMACAELLGGWERLQERIAYWIPHIYIDANPRDEERNTARLDALHRLLLTVSDGYHEHPAIWQPILAGLVRQRDKNERLPQNEIYNLTGGLPTAAIDLGLLGTLHDDNHLLYIVAGKQLTDRQSADAKLTDILHQQYLNFRSL